MRHPLLCWEIVMEGMGRRNTFAKDIKDIQQLMVANNWRSLPVAPDSDLVWENKTILVTDSSLTIVLATANIYEMNGYQPQEVIGKHPRMFQGEATTIQSKQAIRKAVHSALPFQSDIINYRKDGSLYTCRINGYPVFNKQGLLVNFIALENAQ